MWIENAVLIKGPEESISQIHKLFGWNFDLNAVCPMPEDIQLQDHRLTLPAILRCFYVEKGSWMDVFNSKEFLDVIDKTSYKDMNKGQMIEQYMDLLNRQSQVQMEQMRNLGEAYVTAANKYGCCFSRDWRKANWGTPSNTVQSVLAKKEKTYLEYFFSTEDSSPVAIYEKLHNMFPETYIKVTANELGNESKTTYSFGKEKENAEMDF